MNDLAAEPPNPVRRCLHDAHLSHAGHCRHGVVCRLPLSLPQSAHPTRYTYYENLRAAKSPFRVTDGAKSNRYNVLALLSLGLLRHCCFPCCVIVACQEGSTWSAPSARWKPPEPELLRVRVREGVGVRMIMRVTGPSETLVRERERECECE